MFSSLTVYRMVIMCTHANLLRQNLLLDIRNMTKAIHVWTLTSTQSYFPLYLTFFCIQGVIRCLHHWWSKFQDLPEELFCHDSKETKPFLGLHFCSIHLLMLLGFRHMLVGSHCWHDETPQWMTSSGFRKSSSNLVAWKAMGVQREDWEFYWGWRWRWWWRRWRWKLRWKWRWGWRWKWRWGWRWRLKWTWWFKIMTWDDDLRCLSVGVIIPARDGNHVAHTNNQPESPLLFHLLNVVSQFVHEKQVIFPSSDTIFFRVCCQQTLVWVWTHQLGPDRIQTPVNFYKYLWQQRNLRETTDVSRSALHLVFGHNTIWSEWTAKIVGVPPFLELFLANAQAQNNQSPLGGTGNCLHPKPGEYLTCFGRLILNTAPFLNTSF